MYAVIDVETTGARADLGKITEIAVVLHDGEKILGEYSSLINPECSIPPFITQMTGISNALVKDAPKFHEVARKIIELTEGQIFVGHNVNFDYAFVKKEFGNLGYEFKSKTLCTLRLARKLLPKQPTYRLGALAAYLDIPLERAHRALDDARATAVLLTHLLGAAKESSDEQLLDEDVTRLSQKNWWPPHLDASKIEQIPQDAGIYYFYDKQGTILYIGKSKNIKKRVLDHFRSSDATGKRAVFHESIGDIGYERTGSELIAELLEAREIKIHKPYLNRKQKRRGRTFGLFSEMDQEGNVLFLMRKLNENLEEDPLITVGSHKSGESFLVHLMKEFQLDPELVRFDRQAGSLVLPVSHADKVQRRILHKASAREVIRRYSYACDDAVLVGQGRQADERSVILIEQGIYRGFGYLSGDETLKSYEQVKACITPDQETRDVKQILLRAWQKRQSKALFKIWQEPQPVRMQADMQQ